MASPIITPFSAKTETDYRPVSRMAIIGLFFACFSPILFAVDNGVLCLIFFVIPGAVLSILARRAILRSEGNLAGEPIAVLGIVLVVACGLGWATSRLVSVYVNDVEAKETIDHWIAQMKRGEAGGAFLMTMQPKLRNINFNPEDYRRLRLHFPAQQTHETLFDSFLINPIYSQILRYGDRAELKYVAQVETIVYRGAHTFRLKYQITTPISEGDVIFVARSEDVATDQGVRREWYVYLENATSLPRPTRYGEELVGMINRSQEEVKRFILALANAEFDKATQQLDPDPQKRGEDYQTLLGYLRPDNAQEGVLTRLLMPLHLQSEQKTGTVWKLTLECTAVVKEDREVDFSVTATSDGTAGAKWTLGNFKFLGTHKLVQQIPSIAGVGGAEEENPPVDPSKDKEKPLKQK